MNRSQSLILILSGRISFLNLVEQFSKCTDLFFYHKFKDYRISFPFSILLAPQSLCKTIPNSSQFLLLRF